MKTFTLILIVLLPLFGSSQAIDTFPARLTLQQGKRFEKPVMGYVVLTKDCKVVEYLRVNTWRRKERLLQFPKKYTVVGFTAFPKKI